MWRRGFFITSSLLCHNSFPLAKKRWCWTRTAMAFSFLLWIDSKDSFYSEYLGSVLTTKSCVRVSLQHTTREQCFQQYYVLKTISMSISTAQGRCIPWYITQSSWLTHPEGVVYKLHHALFPACVPTWPIHETWKRYFFKENTVFLFQQSCKLWCVESLLHRL